MEQQTIHTETIYAPSSAIGGAIVVIRVSGDASKAIAKRILSRNVTNHPNELTYTRIRFEGKAIDDCMAVYFAAPHSYTGEDMLELHCHGGMQTVREVLACLEKTGAKPAMGGDFTKRAFLNGKMDLAQAEAVMDVINATAETSLRAALHQLHGKVSECIHAVEERLLDSRSAIEAAIDYPDEAEDDFYASLPQSLAEAERTMQKLLTEGRKQRVLRDGVRLVILGRPNVGKSSLLNLILGEDRAIVTSVAGTTRDILDERVSIRGVPVRLMDTAGIRTAEDEAESIGIERAKAAVLHADLLLLVLDGSEPLTEEDERLLKETEGRVRIVVSNKSDLGVQSRAELSISCKSGEGLEPLLDRIVELAAPTAQEEVFLTNERHLSALERALLSVQHAKEAREIDCIATDLREALHQLGTITGTDVDGEVIDRIFQNFCVGK